VRLADPGLSGEIASRLSDLDTSYGVAHTFTIRIPVRRFTMTCVQHWVCRNGSWVKAHKEARQVSVEDINPIVISSATGGPKLTSGDVTRLVRQAQARWRQLERVDAELRAFCGGG
jgi:hypothetical protein